MSSVYFNYGFYYVFKVKVVEDCKDIFCVNDGVCNLLVFVYGYLNIYIF